MNDAPSLVEVNNCEAWPLVGRHHEFPELYKTERRPLRPGMLVASYQGQRRLDATGKMGLGMIVSVRPHPEPMGDVRQVCLVLWNYRHSLTI